ncbi:hypothetical protein [Flavobacterium sp.]|uniref:hypothetical protein n=1 Tax=Flavobacterium sp. TaxID=239 RepID=UPI0025C6C8F4|nr:hypothetical protein [Flavobacterium sp.]
MSFWKASGATNLETGRIVVVGILKEQDKSLHKQMENHLADDLCNLGYDAISSIELYGVKTLEGLDEKQIISKLSNNDITAVLTIVLLSKQKEKYHVPKSMFDLEDRYNSNDFSIYYTAIYNRIYEEGYYVNDTNYFWESNLFSVSDQKLLYSVQTQSFNPFNKASLAHEYGKLIIYDMLENNIIKDIHKRRE